MAKRKRKNPRGHHHRRNPIGTQVKEGLSEGLALGVGALVTRAVMNNLPLPASVQGGIAEAAATAAVAVGLGMGAERFSFSKKYAKNIRDGGIALAVFKAAGPSLLPMLAFTDAAKAHSQVQSQLQTAQQTAAATIAAATAAAANPAQAAQVMSQAATGTNGVGDAFILSRGGITTADRAPRDTAALAGVGDAYTKEPAGFGGAPNGLAAPWSKSVFARR